MTPGLSFHRPLPRRPVNLNAKCQVFRNFKVRDQSFGARQLVIRNAALRAGWSVSA